MTDDPFRLGARLFLPVIKTAQRLLLLAGLIAFGYGALQLGLDGLFWFKGEEGTGRVVGHHSIDMDVIDIPLYGVMIRYIWPPDTGNVYWHQALIGFDEEAGTGYPIGSSVPIRVLKDYPSQARLTGDMEHYLWVALWFGSGLMAVVLISSLFYLHEGLFKAGAPQQVSLFRSVRFRPAGCLFRLMFPVMVVLGIYYFHQRVIPWLGFKEASAIVTGEIRLLPPLLAAKSSPPPGRYLNDAELSIVQIPGLGIAFVEEALEFALRRGDNGEVARYLAAMSDPAIGFRFQSSRVLACASENGNIDAVHQILTGGGYPDTTVMAGFEPIRLATLHNHVAVIEELLSAGAKSSYPDYPLMASAIEGRSAAAADFLLTRAEPETTWRESQTGYTLVDMALRNGMVDLADSLKQRGVPTTLGGYYACAVRGDLSCLAAQLPVQAWKSFRDRDGTLLHLAARHRRLPLARKLIALGADPNSKLFGEGSSATTPLIEAVIEGDIEMVRFLAHLPEIRIDLGDFRHISPLAYAVVRDRWDLIEILVAAGADVSIPLGDPDGNSPLHLVAVKGDIPKAQWLLAHGADVRMTNYRQVTPLDVARSREMIDLLNQASNDATYERTERGM